MNHKIKLYKDCAEHRFSLVQVKCFKMSWSEQLTLEFFLGGSMPGESQGRGSLLGCCLWGHTESDTTEAT